MVTDDLDAVDMLIEATWIWPPVKQSNVNVMVRWQNGAPISDGSDYPVSICSAVCKAP